MLKKVLECSQKTHRFYNGFKRWILMTLNWVKYLHDLSKYTFTTSFVGIPVPSGCGDASDTSALPTKVMEMKAVQCSTEQPDTMIK